MFSVNNEGEKEKMLVTSSLSFFHDLFYPIKGKLELPSAKALSFDLLKILSFRTELKRRISIVYNYTKFHLVSSHWMEFRKKKLITDQRRA